MQERVFEVRIETIAAQGAHTVDPGTGALAPPIHLSTTLGYRDEDSDILTEIEPEFTS